MNSMKNFILLLEEYIDFFDRLLILENEKLVSISNNYVSNLEEHIKHEQAFVLKLRGLDKKREVILSDINMNGFSFKQIIERSQENYKPELISLFNKLNHKLSMFKSVSDSCKKLIELNMFKLNELAEKKGTNGKIYSKQGEINTINKKFTSKRI